VDSSHLSGEAERFAFNLSVRRDQFDMAHTQCLGNLM
jgi:hypothetical protein